MARAMKDSGIEWIGEIPVDWEIKRGKTILRILERPVLDGDGVITCFRDGEVTLRSKRREEGFTFSLQEIGYQGIEPGDLVVHGMDGFAGAIGISDSRGKGTPVLNVLDSSQNKKYLMHYLRSAAYCGLFLSLSTGIRVRSCDTNWNKIKNVRFLLPCLEEQRRIVDFLDRRCGEIDRIIADTQKTIEEYKVLKQSLITEAVTHGIRPNRPMKPSGIEWIGEIPEEWNTLEIKFLCRMQAGKNITSEQIEPEGPFPVYGGNGLRGFYSEYNTDGEYLLVGRQGALCGNVHHVSGKIWATEHAVITEPTKLSDIRFLYYLLIGINLNQFVNNTAAQPGLAVSQIQSVRTCLAPFKEQQEIVEYLDSKCSEIDRLISAKTQLLTELESYKKSLIYEYVTGKKEAPVCQE